MKSGGAGIAAVILLCVSFFAGGCEYERPSMWEMKCAACHDGKTVINGKVVMDKSRMKERFQDLEVFVNICDSSPSCMDILKHDKKLFRDVGREIGIEGPSR